MVTQIGYPLTIHASANPIPVLPEDGSTIRSPGFILPSFYAESNIFIPIQSLEEPPGFMN